ncbi:hypothetical protein GCM10020229_30710 [Kitasatospora albolonga]
MRTFCRKEGAGAAVDMGMRLRGEWGGESDLGRRATRLYGERGGAQARRAAGIQLTQRQPLSTAVSRHAEGASGVLASRIRKAPGVVMASTVATNL